MPIMFPPHHARRHTVRKSVPSAYWDGRKEGLVCEIWKHYSTYFFNGFINDAIIENAKEQTTKNINNTIVPNHVTPNFIGVIFSTLYVA